MFEYISLKKSVICWCRHSVSGVGGVGDQESEVVSREKKTRQNF